ncbi:reverse transcriptase domain, Reverse transcriptase zinc-binding domain protein [Artemisia annua]|uniref:Reverse transcriptase domain, Reverse transcriptase zinc-binding domain protein n=1 Tax=Artemisia annua TaxID=35608 RepID=A0A2U1LHH3_ARTAN|nr:reverse transcriptase domain, Reverse transcriptase zinc-binding domain protein [Artemisia annua]
MDSHQHLFFKCKYTKLFWSKVCLKIGLNWVEMEWNDTVDSLANMDNESTIKNIIRRLSLAASVYLICRERNCRLFKNENRSVDELYEMFVDTIRLRLAGLKAKPTVAVLNAQVEWNVRMVAREKLRPHNTNGPKDSQKFQSQLFYSTKHARYKCLEDLHKNLFVFSILN